MTPARYTNRTTTLLPLIIVPSCPSWLRPVAVAVYSAESAVEGTGADQNVSSCSLAWLPSAHRRRSMHAHGGQSSVHPTGAAVRCRMWAMDSMSQTRWGKGVGQMAIWQDATSARTRSGKQRQFGGMPHSCSCSRLRRHGCTRPALFSSSRAATRQRVPPIVQEVAQALEHVPRLRLFSCGCGGCSASRMSSLNAAKLPAGLPMVSRPQL